MTKERRVYGWHITAGEGMELTNGVVRTTSVDCPDGKDADWTEITEQEDVTDTEALDIITNK